MFSNLSLPTQLTPETPIFTFLLSKTVPGASKLSMEQLTALLNIFPPGEA